VAVVGFAAYRLIHDCDVTFFLFHTDFESAKKHDEEALRDIAAVGIDRSPDPWALFEEFAKRFSLIETGDKRGRPRDIQSIAKAGGGNRDELVFVLLTLFRWNGFDAEQVEIYSSPEAAGERDRAKVIRQLVRVRAPDRVFDPALPPADQHKGSGDALLDGMSRVHYDGAFTTYQCPNSLVRSWSWHRTRSEREPTRESRHPVQ
jgi:hypothetical protein